MLWTVEISIASNISDLGALGIICFPINLTPPNSPIRNSCLEPIVLFSILDELQSWLGDVAGSKDKTFDKLVGLEKSQVADWLTGDREIFEGEISNECVCLSP